MKSLLVIGMLLFTVKSFAKKSPNEPALFSPGVQMGLNFANANVSNPDTTVSTSTGFIGGVFVEIALTEMLFLQPEFMYVEKGAESSTTDLFRRTVEFNYNFNYLQIPVLFKIKYPEGFFKPSAFMGPNLGFLVSASVDQTTNGTSTTTTDISSISSGIDFAWDFGVGGEFLATDTIDILMNIRYSLGFSDIQTSSITWKNTGFQVLFGTKWKF